jgi:hypothetical protein
MERVGGRGYHSENQKASANSRWGNERMDGERGLIGKGAKAEKRRKRLIEKKLKIEEDRRQFHHILSHLDMFGHVAEEYTGDRGSQVTIKIVNMGVKRFLRG